MQNFYIKLKLIIVIQICQNVYCRIIQISDAQFLRVARFLPFCRDVVLQISFMINERYKISELIADVYS